MATLVRKTFSHDPTHRVHKYLFAVALAGSRFRLSLLKLAMPLSKSCRLHDNTGSPSTMLPTWSCLCALDFRLPL